MILIQTTVLSTLTDKQLTGYGYPKIQPIFAKNGWMSQTKGEKG